MTAPDPILSWPSGAVLARAEQLVHTHQRRAWDGGCACGETYRVSHATHVVQALARAGVLAAVLADDEAAEVRPVIPVPAWRSRSFLTGTPLRRFAGGDS